MKKILLILVAMQLQVFALLPPFYEGAKEIDAILSDPALSPLSGEQILRISKTENGYEIETTNHIVFVIVEMIASESIGPAQFKLSFSELIPK